MDETKNNLNEFLRIKFRLNSKSSKLQMEEVQILNSKYLDLRQYFQNKEITRDQIFEKKEALINNLANIKESIEKLIKSKPNAGLSKSQFIGNGGIELFKRLSRDISHIICSKHNGGFGYIDLKTTNNENDLTSYDSFVNFINKEINIVSQHDFENFYSFVEYYTDFESRLIIEFDLLTSANNDLVQ